MRGAWRTARCRLGIALKEIGCALIHGPGNHYWADVVDTGSVRGAACRSCGKYRYSGEPVVDGPALRAWRRVRSWWNAATDPIVSCGGRLGCRLLDRHHYLACRGRGDHAPVDGRIQRVRVVDGRWVPVKGDWP